MHEEARPPKSDAMLLRPNPRLPASIVILVISEAFAFACFVAGIWGWRSAIDDFPAQILALLLLLFAFGVFPILIFTRSKLLVDDTRLARTYALGPTRSWPLREFSHVEELGPEVAFVGQKGVLFKAAPGYWGEAPLQAFVTEVTARRDTAFGDR